jgi:hypothetical protein
MPVPQFLTDLLSLLYAIATPAAALTLVAAGLSLRTEGGMNFHVTGRTGKWIMWTVILLTLPQVLHWMAAQGIHVPDNPGSNGSGWISGIATAFQNFVNQVINKFCAGRGRLHDPEGNTRCRLGRQPTSVDHRGDLSAVDQGDDPDVSGMELWKRHGDHRHAPAVLELSCGQRHATGRRPVLRSGSANWSVSAARYQDNEVSVTTDPAMVAAFSREFRAMWDRPDNSQVR